jgi:hypothetical protein
VARRAPLRQPKVRKILDPTDPAHWSPSLARGRIANASLHQLEPACDSREPQIDLQEIASKAKNWQIRLLEGAQSFSPFNGF